MLSGIKPSLLFILIALAGCGSREPALQDTATPPPPPPPESALWEGQSGGLHIRWTPSDLRVERGEGELRFSARDLTARDFARWRAEVETQSDFDSTGTRWPDCVYERRFVLLSVIGSIVSIEDSEVAGCEGDHRPSIRTRVSALDLQRAPAEPGDSTGSYAASAARVSLGDLVEHGVLRRALASEPLVRMLFRRLGDPKPASLFALTSILVEANGPVQRGCRAEFTRDMLSRFAVDRVDADRAHMRLVLATSDSACLGARPELAFAVPLQNFTGELESAASGTEGVLLERTRTIAETGVTVIRYRLPDDAPRTPKRRSGR